MVEKFQRISQNVSCYLKMLWRPMKKGVIHFHDSDYFAQHMHNCCLVNLEDMLQNGTVISETMIEKPHSFSTDM